MHVPINIVVMRDIAIGVETAYGLDADQSA
jgi:hypothetical protein